MTIQKIIEYGRLKADIPQTNFYSDSEAVADLNTSWRDIYALLMENNDDFFVTELPFTLSECVAIDNHDGCITYTMPDDFYRLRLLQYQAGGAWNAVYKMTIENEGNTQNYPAYRIVNNKLYLYDKGSTNNYYAWYYPQPIEWTLYDSVTYPVNMIPQVMGYQIAVEIKRKQSLDTGALEQRKQQLIQTMMRDLKRDNFKNEKVSNVYSTSFNPYR